MDLITPRKDRFTSETKFILCCLKTKIDEDIQYQLRELLKSSLDWEYILKQARYHEVSPWLYSNINKIHASNIPETAFSILENSYYNTLAKNMHLWREFCYIQDAFSKTGIEIIPLKGIILSKTLYRNLSPRPMEDIDVLIQEKKLLNAKNKLLQLGYKIYLKDLPEYYWKKYHCHFTFRNFDKNMALELHWAFAPPRPHNPDLSLIWKRCKPQTIDRTETLTLGLEDTLFSLCFHICRNVSNLQNLKLKWLCDINELITQHGSNLDWCYIIDKVTAWRLRGTFSYLHLLTKKYLNTNWPNECYVALCPDVVRKSILNFYDLKSKRTSRLRAMSLMLILLDTISDRFSLCLLGISILLQKYKVFTLNLKRR